MPCYLPIFPSHEASVAYSQCHACYVTGRSHAHRAAHAAAHAERSCVKGRLEAVDGIQNPNPRPDPRIFLKISPNPSAYKILRSVTTLELAVLFVIVCTVCVE